ncbi:MAG: FAD binding domain-containing protein [Desulforhopalus sp.]|nr:FAD binding domain-containing protein [Desulforhopalus sp.]
MKISFELNGATKTLEAPADRRVIDLLREDLGLTGSKEGCGTGECGACTILVDGRSRLSCLMLAGQLPGKKLTTIEGLAQGDNLHPLQASFAAKGAVQCGFCTPGMVLTAADLLERKPRPARQEVVEAISGNLCRCTGYQKIIEAIEDVGEVAPISLPRQEEAALTHPSPAVQGKAGSSRPVFLPETLEELWRLRTDHPGAQLFAGGTDLLVWLRSGRINPPALIGLEKIGELQGIVEGDEGLHIGAGVTHESLLDSEKIKGMFPVLSQALKKLGSPHIRRTGTLGGNIMTASPAGDSLPPLSVLGARVLLQSPQGKRQLPLEAFILGPGRTALLPGEILTAIFIPRPAGITFQYFEKVGLREAMACAVASLAAVLGVARSGRIDTARLAWGSVGPTVVRLPDIEAALIGRNFTTETIAAIVPLVQQQLAPISDVRTSAEYRRLVAGNLLLRLPTVYSATQAPDTTGQHAEDEK